jgi:hypothetical protein
MSRFPKLFALVTLSFGVAQASAVYINTFTLGQVLPDGPGPTAPLAPFTIGDAVTLDALGVTFDYTVGPSATDAVYGDSSFDGIDPVPSSPVLSGAGDGTLTLTFDSATDFVAFDIFYLVEAGNSGGSVTLGGAGGTLATDLFTTTSDGLGLFSIGHFDSTGTTSSAITTAVITFNEPGAVAFGIDNLSFDTTPEPTSLALLALGALLFGGLVRLRRSSLRASDRP